MPVQVLLVVSGVGEGIWLCWAHGLRLIDCLDLDPYPLSFWRVYADTWAEDSFSVRMLVTLLLWRPNLWFSSSLLLSLESYFHKYHASCSNITVLHFCSSWTSRAVLWTHLWQTSRHMARRFSPIQLLLYPPACWSYKTRKTGNWKKSHGEKPHSFAYLAHRHLTEQDMASGVQ